MKSYYDIKFSTILELFNMISKILYYYDKESMNIRGYERPVNAAEDLDRIRSILTSVDGYDGEVYEKNIRRKYSSCFKDDGDIIVNIFVIDSIFNIEDNSYTTVKLSVPLFSDGDREYTVLISEDMFDLDNVQDLDIKFESISLIFKLILNLAEPPKDRLRSRIVISTNKIAKFLASLLIDNGESNKYIENVLDTCLLEGYDFICLNMNMQNEIKDNLCKYISE